MPARGVAQSGSALRSGRRGRRFESSHPDFALRSSAKSEGGLFNFFGFNQSILLQGLRRTQPDCWTEERSLIFA